MQIAVLGWGSLIWCPGSLRIKTPWHNDGPELPIEFARISGDRRLTLVLHPGSPNQRTYWSPSMFETLEAARENLKVREGTVPKHIHSLTNSGQAVVEIDRVIAAAIHDWLDTKQHLNAAIWTGLPSNWNERRGQQFSPEDAVAHATELESTQAEYDRAREYVSNAPAQIQTPARRLLRERKGWIDAALSPSLFVT
jgi:hypothetical protein